MVHEKQPPSFIITAKEHKVLKLCKALYMLRHAPWAWNIKLNNTLVSLAFAMCTTKQNLNTQWVEKGTLVAGVYVDDLIMTFSKPHDIENFKEMKNMLCMGDLRVFPYYLGIEVEQQKDGVVLC